MSQSAPAHRATVLPIQILRAAAAIVVVLTHLGYEFEHAGLPDTWPKFFSIGNVGVDLFFVISGFVMVYSSARLFARAGAPKEFFLLRLTRIVPLYWAITSIVLLYLVSHYGSLAAANLSPASVIASYLFVPYPQLNGFMAPVHGVGWTLNYEMFFYACFAFALLAPRRTGVFALSCGLLALVVLNRLVALPGPLGRWADPIILEFVLGMLVALLFESGLRIPKMLALAITAVVVIDFVTARSFDFSGADRWIVWGLPAACMIGALVCANFSGKPTPITRALVFLGDASYAIYLVHPLSGPAVRPLLHRLVDPAAHPWLYASLLMCAIISAASLIHVFLEKPATRMLRSRVRSASARTTRSAGDGDAAAVQRGVSQQPQPDVG